MNYLGKNENGVVLAPEVTIQLLQIETMKKELKAKEDELRGQLLKEMEEQGVVKIETSQLLVSYVAETYTERIDSKKLKIDNPELFDKYVKISPVKSSIRVKVKNDNVEH